jgi:hypothetical protein
MRDSTRMAIELSEINIQITYVTGNQIVLELPRGFPEN